MKLTPSLQRRVDLIYLLTRKEISLKYKRTILGIFWSLLNPILLACVFFFAFKVFMRFKIENYTFFLLSALFPWTWFSSSILISGRSLVDNVSLVKKVVFPRHYLVISVILAQLIHLIFSFPILLFFSFFKSHGPSAAWFVGIPLLIAIQMTFTFGIALVVSIVNTYFRDTEYLVGVLINLLFWMTPITYPLDSIPGSLRPFFMLNPLTSIIFSWRELFLNNVILWDKLGLAGAMSLALYFAGKHIFVRMERRLDEVL